MTVMDLEEQYQYKEEDMQIENINKMYSVLRYFNFLCKENKIDYQEKQTLWDTFSTNYCMLCQIGKKADINLYMKKNNSNEYSFIYEMLHYRFKDKDISSKLISSSDYVTLDIDNKHFEFKEASSYFKDPKIKEVFMKKLDKECFDRTLDLVYCIEGSKAIVSYLPNMLVGGYYHAYIECSDGKLIDPASNLIMLNEESKHLLDGDVILSMTKEELTLALAQLNEVDRIEAYDRPLLLKLALFYECKEIEKENISSKRR